MGQLIVLMGPTGAGKSVQGDILAKALAGVHLSSGDILRGSPLAAATLSGKLLPAAEVERLVGEAIDAVPQGQPIVLDGFPRTMSNVEWLDQKLPQHGRRLARVVLLELDLGAVTRRLQLRSRADDTVEAIEQKWDEYQTRTKPVIDHYRAAGLLTDVDGQGTVDAVAGRVLAVVQAQVP